MPVIIRDKILFSDLENIRNIVTDTQFFSQCEIDMAVELAAVTFKNPDEYYFLFAELNEETVAFCNYSLIPCTIGSFSLYWIAVRKKAQGMGIGKQLIEAVENNIKSKGGKQLFISTSSLESYSGTRMFYEKVGFSVAAVLPNFYKEGDDEVIFRKTL
jgi:ribosomal protein S18 acetylase RimI-like enzyme